MPSAPSPRLWSPDSGLRAAPAYDGLPLPPAPPLPPPPSLPRSSAPSRAASCECCISGNGADSPRGHTRLPGLAAMLPTKPSSPELQQHSRPPPPPSHHFHNRQGQQHQLHRHRHNPQHHLQHGTSSPAPRPLSPPSSATTTTGPQAIPRPPLLTTSGQSSQGQQPPLPHSPAPTPVTAPVSAVTASPSSTSPNSAFSSAPVSASTTALPMAPRSAGSKRPAAADLQRSVSTAPPLKRPATSSTVPLPASTIKGSGSPSPAPAIIYHEYMRQLPASTALPQVMSTSATTTSIPLLPVPSAAMMHQPLTADQLQGKSSEQLIHAVLQLQSQHHQYVAHISTQYQNISQQLAELRGSLHAFYSGQAACHQAAASAISPSSALTISTPRDPFSSSRQTTAPVLPAVPQQPPTAPQQAPASGHYHQRPSTSHSRSGSQRLPPLSPTTEAGVLPRPPGQGSATSSGPPTYEYRTVATVEEVWREYKEGIDGQPAIEDLDASWGSRWRPEPRGRTWYSRRKVIWDKIKEYMSDGLDESAAVREVEKLRDGGTINKLIRLLQDERKDRGLDDSLLA
ncbi:transcriptional activator of glycolytic enzymes-domain-containing protein [Microdochium trichocladiopsis]|uniref:Transcriptional activator of glycolytic enzymes-domain-containing protein n=1 Tax=Microdochium trichocladiopsis TaxID=1682393 RepID=A0A9P8YIF1_9PEZI|nr:transcriptional activator of glycolytic enzymes-domain-containing protein [Microdochium trichocladiopsis]KAH7040969.1 transcriptional activator of glycolytic enzymes-domain-containing protein [Microdochium trichocladiopsis]